MPADASAATVVDGAVSAGWVSAAGSPEHAHSKTVSATSDNLIIGFVVIGSVTPAL
jgi:hypothetical protein